MSAVQEAMNNLTEGVDKHVGGVANKCPTIFAAVLVIASVGALIGVMIQLTHGVDPISMDLLNNGIGYTFISLTVLSLAVVWKMQDATEKEKKDSKAYQGAMAILKCAALVGGFFLGHYLASSAVPKILDPYMPIDVPGIGSVPMPPMWKITEAKTLMIDTIVNNGMAGVAMLFHSGTKKSKYRATFETGAKGLSLLAIVGALVAGTVALSAYGKQSVISMSAPLLAEVIAGAGGALIVGGVVLYSLLNPEKERRLSTDMNKRSLKLHEDALENMRHADG